MYNSNDFLAWEQSSRDTIDFKTIYVDVAGDIVTGLLLSQIIYWNLPDKQGQTKLRVEIDNELWLAKGREDWYDECRISKKQFDRSIKILQNKNIVETKLKKFNGHPMKHIKLNVDILVQELSRIKQGVKSDLPKGEKGIPILPFGENGYSPKGKMDIPQRVKSLTENTTKTTTENTMMMIGESEEIEKPKPKISSSPLFNFYDKNIGLMSEHISNEILSYIDDGIEEDLIKRCLEIAVENNAANWKYAKSIIESKLKLNIKTLKDFEAAEVNYQNKKNNKNNKYNNDLYDNRNNFEQREYKEEDMEKYYYKVGGEK